MNCIDVAKSPQTSASVIQAMLSELCGTPIVYFVGLREFVKIGYSENLAARFRALGNLPEPLTIFHFEPGSRADERTYHRRFSEYRANGEWFLHSGLLADFIAQKQHSIVLT